MYVRLIPNLCPTNPKFMPTLFLNVFQIYLKFMTNLFQIYANFMFKCIPNVFQLYVQLIPTLC